MTMGPDPVLAYLIDDLAALDRFDANTVLTVAIGGTLVTGTPIAESAYFDHLGEQFRHAVGPGIDQVRFHFSVASREMEHGWDEDQFRRMPWDRERAYKRMGEDAQDAVRQRIQARPRRVSEYSVDEGEQTTMHEQLNTLFGDDAAPHRRHVHLKDVVVYGVSTNPIRIPFWRVRLEAVSGWYLGPVEPITEG